ncbi:TPA: hypothetical protein ACGU4A_003959 [Vibrio vulnificus]
MKKILKLDGSAIAPSQKLVQLYVVTNGEEPSISSNTDMVLLPATNAKMALDTANHKIVAKYLNCKKTTLWRLSTYKSDTAFTRVSSIQDDYRYEQIADIAKNVYQILEESSLIKLSKTKAHRLLKEVIFSIFSLPKSSVAEKDTFDILLRAVVDGALRYRTTSDLPVEWFETLAKANQTTTNKNTVNVLNSIVNLLLKNRLHLEKIESGSKQQLIVDTLSGVANINGESWVYTLLNCNEIPVVNVESSKFQETLWRIRSLEANSWEYFLQNCLAKSEFLAEYLAKIGVTTCKLALEQSIIQDKTISGIYDNKAETNDELLNAFDRIELQYLSSEGTWTSYFPQKLPKYGSLSEKECQSYTLARKACLDKYGHTGFMSYFMPSLNRYSEPLTDRWEVENWISWCEKTKPTFVSYTEYSGKEVKAKISTRKTKVKVIDAKVKRHMTEERKAELNNISETTKQIFTSVWSKAIAELELTLPPLVFSEVFDTQNKFKEYYINPEGVKDTHTHVEVNLGCTFNKVDLNDDAIKPTIEYTNPHLNVDRTFTLAEFAEIKAAETIADYLANNTTLFAANILKVAGINKEVIGKKKLLMIELTKAISKNL